MTRRSEKGSALTKALVAIAAIALAAAIGAGVWLLQPGASAPGGEDAEAQAQSSSAAGANVRVVEANENRGIDAEKIEGIEKTGLTEEEVRILGTYLTYNLPDGASMDGSELTVEEAEGYDPAVINITVKETKSAYNVKLGKTWEIHEGKAEAFTPEPERKAPGEQASASQSADEKAPETSILNSTQTAFDDKSAWPLSSRDKVEPIVGKNIADRLLADVNAYLAEGGISVAKEADLLVASQASSKSSSVVEFNVLALAGADRIVLKCSYDPSTLKHAIVWQP